MVIDYKALVCPSIESYSPYVCRDDRSLFVSFVSPSQRECTHNCANAQSVRRVNEMGEGGKTEFMEGLMGVRTMRLVCFLVE